MNGVNSEMVLDGFLQEADAAEMRSDYVCSQTPIPTGISQGKEIRPSSECPLRPQTCAHLFSAGSHQFEPKPTALLINRFALAAWARLT